MAIHILSEGLTHSSLPLWPFSNTSDLPCTIPIFLFSLFVNPLFQFHSSLSLPLLHLNSVLPPSSPNICSSLNSESVLPWSPLLSEPPVFKTLVSFNTNQSDYWVLLHTLLYMTNLCLQTSLQSPSSDLYPTSVQLPSDSSLLWPLQNYRTYLHIIQVGATHKLKPSPTYYPLPITC